MATIVNFDLNRKDPETALICFSNIFRHLVQYRDNLKKTYFLSQVISWLEIDSLSDDSHTSLGPIRYFPRLKINRVMIDSQVYDLIFN